MLMRSCAKSFSNHNPTHRTGCRCEEIALRRQDPAMRAGRQTLGGRPCFTKSGFLYVLGWLPKLDLIAIWIFNPRKVSVGGIFRGLFDCHALTLKVVEDFSQ